MLVSIITTTKDSIMPRTVKSILNQTNKNFEWITVFDGVPNGFTYYHHDEYPETKSILLYNNYGPSVARNVGFQVSSGNIITYLDSDDELHPRRIEDLINLFTKYEPDLVFSDYCMIQGYPNGYRFSHFDYIGTEKYPDAIEYIKLLQKQNIAIPLGVAHTRKPFIECGGFQRGIVCGEDGILWRRMVDKINPSKIIFSNDLAGTYYINENGQSRSQRRFQEGGFAFDGSLNDNGKYLDEDWFETYNSKELFDD